MLYILLKSILISINHSIVILRSSNTEIISAVKILLLKIDKKKKVAVGKGQIIHLRICSLEKRLRVRKKVAHFIDYPTARQQKQSYLFCFLF